MAAGELYAIDEVFRAVDAAPRTDGAVPHRPQYRTRGLLYRIEKLTPRHCGASTKLFFAPAEVAARATEKK
jgi:hypothetical protein